ncbi:MAG: HD domain-containing protein [Clostridia bacterium]|nr:HD domain-containing protein [Clostridia bacterium]
MVIKIPQQVNRAIEILRQSGYSAYVVGGAVRDALMGHEAHDWDIATSAKPKETLEVFRDFRVIETGVKHGTVTVIIDGESLEITTYRTESGYSDGRHPDRVEFTDMIEDDLSRRDFTVNAIAYSPLAGIADPFGGCRDIEAKTIRCVGEPDKRFGEDALRILRALRFSATLGFDIDKSTSDSIIGNYKLLERISVERIFVELSKLLCGKDAKRILLDYSEVFFFLIPELKPMKGCTQNHERHIFDVWGHTVQAVESVESKVHLRLAMLFHDSGKPLVKSTDEKGIDHFYGHSKKSREMAFYALTRLKVSNKLRDKVCNLVEYHDFLPDRISKKTYKKYIGLLGEETVEELFEIRRADISAQNPKFLSDEMKANEFGMKILNEIKNENSCLKINDLAINGNDLEKAGIPPSPVMGRILEALLDEVLEEKTENNKKALLKRANELKNKIS